nr:hypothetical protein [Tanacetum cinerariifolium]
MWSDQEKRVQKIDRLERSLLIQGLPNDIYSLIDSNKTTKYLWDALVRHMFGSEYGEQDRKAAVLYEYETFKATEGELLLDTYIRYLQGLEVGLIRRIQGTGYGLLDFLRVGTTFDFFQNIHILYLVYGVLSFSRYDVLDFSPLWSLVSLGTDTPYLP